MDSTERYKTSTDLIYKSMLKNSFDDAYRLITSYINFPEDGQNEKRKQEMKHLINYAEDKLKTDRNINTFLTGGNQHTKRTRRTTHRKMRKSIIRRRK